MTELSAIHSNATSARIYEARDADLAAQREQALAVWHGNLGSDAQFARKFDWFYRSNPQPGSMLKLLFEVREGSAVGVAGLGARRFVVDGDEISAGLLVDLAVAPEHRALQPAMLLQRAVLASGLHSHAFVYGFPNRKAVPVFQRVGFQRVGEIIRYAAPVRHVAYLRRQVPGWLAVLTAPWVDRVQQQRRRRHAGGRDSVRWSLLVDPAVDALWQRARAALVRGCRVACRDRAFLTWRFERQPLHSYRYLSLRRAGEVVPWAHAVCEQVDSTLHVRDFVVDPHRVDGVLALFAVVQREAYRQGAASVSVEFLGDAAIQRQMRAAGLVARGARPVFAAPVEATSDRSAGPHWYLTSADEDE